MIRSLLILGFLQILFYSPIPAQICGASIEPEQESFIRQRHSVMRSFNARTTRGIRDFPIQAHVLRKSDGSGGISDAGIHQAIETLNSYFINANIRFVLMENINYINSSWHYDFQMENEGKISSKYDVDKVINLYLFNTIKEGNQDLCGYAHYPNKYSYKRNKDRVLMRNSCAENGSSIVHEFGHFFSLFHTHGNPEYGTVKELVSRNPGTRNCQEAGDGLCDTAADPGILNYVDDFCRYIGTKLDPRGNKYQPDTRNVMAYSLVNCRDRLTQEQYNRMNYAALHLRNYMLFPQTAMLPKEEVLVVNNYETPVEQNELLSGEVYLEISGQAMPVILDGNLFKGAEPYYSGTSYQLSIRNDEEAYVYVFSSDLSGKNYLLYPRPGQSAYVSGKEKKISLPGNGRLFTLDENRGKDYLCVLYSRKPLDLNAILKKMEEEDGNFLQRLYRITGKDLISSNRIQYSHEGSIRFEAEAGTRNVVPIIVEFRHL